MLIKSESIRILWGLTKPHVVKSLLMFVALICSSASILGLSRAVRFMVDQGLGAEHDLIPAVLSFVVIGVILATATSFRAFYVSSIVESVSADLRRLLYQSILHFKPHDVASCDKGMLINILTSDVLEFKEALANGISVGTRNVILLLGAITMLLLTSPMLTAVLLGSILIVMLPVSFMRRYYKNANKKVQEGLTSITSIAEEGISALKTIQLYAGAALEYDTYSDRVKQVSEKQLVRMIVKAILTFIVMASVMCALALVMWCGGRSIAAGSLSPGGLGSFMFLGILAAFSIPSLVEALFNLRKALMAFERMLPLLNARSQETVENRNRTDAADKSTLDAGETKNCLSLQHIHFDYQPEGGSRQAKGESKLTEDTQQERESFVIKDLSMTFNKGETVAIVGPSGVGKSTIMQLLLRFYTPTAGSVLYQGRNIDDINLSEWYSKLAYAGPDSSIFSASVIYNVKYGNRDATEKEVNEVLKAAALDDWIKTLPDGENTFVGYKGAALSQGQKQRILIARALLKKPEILLLDEAMTGLDLATEASVKNGVASVMKGRTVIVIAHRLSTFIEADKIIVLSNGCVVEEGKHDELLAANGHYATLYSREI